VSQSVSESKKFVKDVVSDVKKQYKIDFSFALTWGAAIGGFVGPIARYMEGKYPSLTHSDITLLSFACILTYFSSNKDKLSKVLDLIKEKKLVTYFQQMLMKSEDLKESFFGFLSSLNITFSKVGNMLAYTFLVPLVPMLKHVADMDLPKDQLDLLIKSIIGYAAVLTSSVVVRDVVEKIIKRFRD
jgi:uncharacterized protein YlxP (DUF503 family)